MTPFILDILLHYHVSQSEHPVVRENPPIWAETRDWMLAEGLLIVSPSEYGGTYKTGERANVFIRYIMELPLPVWSMQ